MPVIQTAYGSVDQDGLEQLRDEFDTTSILRAIDAVDQARRQLDELRASLLDMHGVTMHLINDGPMTISSEFSDVHELVENVQSGAFDVSEAMEVIQELTTQLENLGSDDVWEEID